MTGIDGTDNGNEIVSLSAVCKKSNTIARVGPAGLYLAFDGPSSTTSPIGSAIGAPFSLSCDSGELVIGIFGKVTFLGRVRSINLQCAPLLSTGPTSSAGPGGAPELLLDAPYEITCTAALPGLRGYAAWGLHASVNGSGDIVSLTLRCR